MSTVVLKYFKTRKAQHFKEPVSWRSISKRKKSLSYKESDHTPPPNNKPLEINARGFIICAICATAGKFVVLSKLVMPKRLVIG
jgi:hypothetical protein